MLVKVDDDLYINDSAVMTLQKDHRGYFLEMVNGNKLAVSYETAELFMPKQRQTRKKKEVADADSV